VGIVHVGTCGRQINKKQVGSTAFSAGGGDGLAQGLQAFVLAPRLQVPVLGASPGVVEPSHARASMDQREVQVEVTPQQPSVPASAALSDEVF